MSYSGQASNQVFDYITGNISSGKWVPGTKIATEEQLGDALGVSRIAVRQAIEKLSALSVLKKVQGSGTYVNSFEDASLMGLEYYPPTQETMLTVLEFRRMFDPYNTELFIRNATPDELKALEESFEQMVQAQDDPVQFQSCDNAFHNLIAEGTHNAVIRQISHTLTKLLMRHQTLRYDDCAAKWHAMILDAIRSKEEELVHIYAKIHIDNSIRVLRGEPPKKPGELSFN